jgi:hypothetical protein
MVAVIAGNAYYGGIEGLPVPDLKLLFNDSAAYVICK